MFFRLAITKATSDNEQIVVDVPSWNPVTGAVEHHTVEDAAKVFYQLLTLADVRTQEMHVRKLEGYNLLSYFNDAERQKVIELIDVMTGRESAAVVATRWQSIEEENEALRKGREEVYRANCKDIANDASS